MNYDKINQYLEPLLRASSPHEKQWLNKLFKDPTSSEIYNALDNELFIRNSFSTGPILITSAMRGEGRTTIAMLLAVFSSAFDPSKKVLLVDADVDNGNLATTFGLKEASKGLNEFFNGEASVSECIYQTALPNLCLTPRSGNSEGAIRLSPKAFEVFIGEVRDKFDLVVVDSPAGGPNKAILSMANIIKNMFVVIKYGGPAREQVATLLSELNRVEAHVLGCILNQREFVVPRLLYGSR